MAEKSAPARKTTARKTPAKKVQRGAAKPSLAVMQKAQRAAELKIAGATWGQIAKELNYKSESGARLAVKRHFERAAVEVHAEMYPILNERAEALWRKAWVKVNQAGSIEEWDKAMRQAQQALVNSARINGLYDKQPLVEVNVTTNAELVELRQELQEILTLEPEDVRTAPVPNNVIE